jgi:hypothetical protein
MHQDPQSNKDQGKTIRYVNTPRGPVEVYPGLRCRIIGYENGRVVTQEFPIFIAEWRGKKASGCTEDEAVKKVVQG